MKPTIISLLFFFGVIFFFMSHKKDYHPSRGETLVNSLLGKSAKIIRDKHNLKPCGVGAAMPGGPIQHVTLCFDTNKPYTKDQLREALIKASQEIINQFFENKEVQIFLKEPPFSIKNVQIIIYNHDQEGRSLKDPEISNAELYDKELTYSTIDPIDSFKYKNEFTETYEEALKAIKSERILNNE